MALTANTLPSIPANFSLPVDAALEFASAQTISATGYINNVNAVVDLGQGRFTGMLALDITAIDISSGNESYGIALFGSNDINFGNGNVDLLTYHDFAAASAGRLVATILGISPTIPPNNFQGGSITALPFTTLVQGIVYRYAKLYAVIGGTTPSLTLSAWIVPMNIVI
jgi:hypothetical protein